MPATLTTTQAVNQVFQQVYAMPGTDRLQRMFLGSLHNLTIANIGQIPGAYVSGQSVNWPALVQSILTLLANLPVIANGGFLGEIFNVLIGILSGLFPAPVTP